MAEELIREIEPYVTLHRDNKTGIAWVADGRTGCWHSAHPNIHTSGSIKGMKRQGFWKKDDVCVRSNGLIYNTSILTVTDELDEIARQHCQCGGKH